MQGMKIGGSMRKAVVLITLIVWAALSFAQTPTGTFQGSITDSSGAAVKGATVIVTSTTTGIEKTSTTDDEGRYTMPYVLPGTYKVAVKAQGFRPAQQENVVLEVSQTRSLDFSLKVGATTDVVVTLFFPLDG